MEEALARRVRLLRDGGGVPRAVADFVAAELDLLVSAGAVVTEATAGTLTSHLLSALTRLVNGEAIEEHTDDARIAAELDGHPEAVARARGLAARAERTFERPLPNGEIAFLGMHLAVLARCS